MIGKTDKNPQLNVFRIPLVNVINMKHELVELAQRIDWRSVEKDFAPYYADMGRPAVPVRKMVGSMLLKQMFGLSDEAFVDRWVENVYWRVSRGHSYILSG
jgi:IS5 family transposase